MTYRLIVHALCSPNRADVLLLDPDKRDGEIKRWLG